MLNMFIKNEQKKEIKKYYILDYSFYIYNGSFAYNPKCDCVKRSATKEADPLCKVCRGDGRLGLKADGIKTGGLFHVMNQTIKAMKDGYQVVQVFDPPKENLDRSKLIDAYKGNRPPTPEWIEWQMNWGERVFPHTKNILCLTSDADESDDVMATFALEKADEGHTVIVASDDKDMFPLLEHKNIKLHRQKAIFDKADFITKFGFPPERFSEYLAIVGDAADNYNLIKGLGEKAAKEIIKDFDNIMDVFDDWDKLPKKYQTKLSYSCAGDKCEVCNGSTKKCVIKMKDELETSLQLAYLNTKVEYRAVKFNDDSELVCNEFKRLRLKNAVDNIDLFF